MKKGPKLFCSIRFLIAILCFFLNAIHFMQRVNISVGIVCMVNASYQGEKYNKNDDETSLSNEESTNFSLKLVVKIQPTLTSSIWKSFEWSKQLQGAILGSIFIGSFLSQIPAGWLTLIVGPKIILLISVFLASTLTCLTPLAAFQSYKLLIVFRFLIGIAQGCVTGSLNVIWASWAPPLERSTLLAISNSGLLIGNALTFMFGGIICMSDAVGGWPFLFVLTGLLGIFWCVLWALVVTDTPQTQKCITQEEKLYIVETTNEHSFKTKQNKKIQWKKMLTSKVVLGLIVTNLCSNFGISLFIMCLPTYINDVLGFDIASNGELSSIPFFTCLLAVLFSGIVSDHLVRTEKFSKLFIRKLFNSIGFFVPILTLIGLIFVDSNTRFIAFGLILVNMTFSGFQYGSGYLVSFNDVGGTFAGIIYGVANTLAMLASFMAPYLMGLITSNKTNRNGWMHIFIITSVVQTIGAVSFLFLGSAETIDWAKNNKIERTRINKDNDKEAEVEAESLVELKR